MGYEVSINNAWSTLKGNSGKVMVRFLNDEYEVDFSAQSILSLSCNVQAKDYYKILILHYLSKEHIVQSIENDKWISFKELEGGEAYFSAFRKRAIEPILRKYGDGPLALRNRAGSLNAELLDKGNVGISVKAFLKINVGIIMWAKDEEFGAECNMLFNSSIRHILPTEDAAVLGGIIASLL